MLQAPLLAMKKQGIVLFQVIQDNYMIGIPLSAILAFNASMGVNGLFLGGTFGALWALLQALSRVLSTDF